MHRAFNLVLGLGLVLAASVSVLALGAQERSLERAFEHYERIRVALAQDTTKGIAPEATALSPLARDMAGEAAGRAATSLAQAKDIEAAREQFGVLSEALVPKFLEAGLPGVEGFVCSMKQKRWVQRSDKADNPYYGRSMATCGTPIKGSGSRKRPHKEGARHEARGEHISRDRCGTAAWWLCHRPSRPDARARR